MPAHAGTDTCLGVGGWLRRWLAPAQRCCLLPAPRSAPTAHVPLLAQYALTNAQAHPAAAAAAADDDDDDGTAPHAGRESGTLAITIPELPQAQATQQVSFPTAGDHFREVPLYLSYKQLELWWPVGYGQARLYNLTASYQAGGGPACCGAGGQQQGGQEGGSCDGQCSRQSRWAGACMAVHGSAWQCVAGGVVVAQAHAPCRLHVAPQASPQ